ncbi:unnamed protein product [Phytophthora lilii]|uniref:Unnamed protein product n=1 Tax=Phytophthora lilii TaxID=2077276 RepID=A0A9W6YDX6_9STRA|nr:unnamed protein product [Phytophthora lilii]
MVQHTERGYSNQTTNHLVLPRTDSPPPPYDDLFGIETVSCSQNQSTSSRLSSHLPPAKLLPASTPPYNPPEADIRKKALSPEEQLQQLLQQMLPQSQPPNLEKRHKSPQMPTKPTKPPTYNTATHSSSNNDTAEWDDQRAQDLFMQLFNFGVQDVDVATKVTKKIKLSAPIVSSPMDTVTEANMAIAIALQGGLGFLHCNNTIEQQAEMVRTVKHYENGFIPEPKVLSPSNTVADLDELKVSGVPITENGSVTGKLVGLVTSRDVDFLEDRSVPLSRIMVPLEQLVVGTYPISLEQANKTLKEAKKGTLPIVDASGNLVSLMTRLDLLKHRDYPNAVRDPETHKLRVGAAVSVSEQAKPRIDALVAAGADVIALDARQGDSDLQFELVKVRLPFYLALSVLFFKLTRIVAQYIKQTHPSVEVVGGNVVTIKQVKNLLDAGVDGVRVGMGVGSVSTSQVVKAVGRAQLSAIYNSALLAKDYGVPVIADGGIGSPGAAIKALSLGASVVMMGSSLAGTVEAPGDYFFQDGMRLKHYYGSGSHEYYRHGDAAHAAAAASHVAVGVSGAVVDQGSVHKYLPYIQQSIRHGFQDLGVRSIPQLHASLYSGELRFERRTISAQKEGGVHDLFTYSKQLYA